MCSDRSSSFIGSHVHTGELICIKKSEGQSRRSENKVSYKLRFFCLSFCCYFVNFDQQWLHVSIQTAAVPPQPSCFFSHWPQADAGNKNVLWTTSLVNWGLLGHVAPCWTIYRYLKCSLTLQWNGCFGNKVISCGWKVCLSCLGSLGAGLFWVLRCSEKQFSSLSSKYYCFNVFYYQIFYICFSNEWPKSG